MTGRDIFGVVLVTALATAVVVTGFSNRPDLPIAQYLLGETGVLPFVAALTTTAILFIGARHAERAFRHAQISELAARFQKGVELLANPATTASVGGIAILTDVARQNPQRYLGPTLTTLLAKISETDRAVKQTFDHYSDNQISTGASYPRSDRSTGRALSAFSSFNPYPKPWSVDVIKLHGRAILQDVYLSDTLREEDNFAGFALVNFACARVTFRNCSFQDASLVLNVGGRVDFERCNFRNAKIQFVRTDFRTPDTGAHLRVQFRECLLDQATIGDIDAAVSIAAADTSTTRRPIIAGGTQGAKV